MPFQAARYPPNWKEISLARRDQAGWRCEWCGAEYGKPHPETGSKVVLSVAHLGAPIGDRPGDKHNKHDVRPENLACLCARCHLRYDIDEHIFNAAATRRRRRIAAGQLEIEFAAQQEQP